MRQDNTLGFSPLATIFPLWYCFHSKGRFMVSQGYDIYRVSERGMSRARDSDIVALALAEQRAIVTMDLDFAAIIAKSGEQFPSAIIFRLEDS
jgi:predicted nuclease of predicted toxin-antitoxin system